MKLTFISYDLANRRLKIKTETDTDTTKKDAKTLLLEENQDIELEKFLTWHLHRYFGMAIDFEGGKNKKSFTVEKCDPISFVLESKIAFLRAGVTEENWDDFENAVREAHIAARINEKAAMLNLEQPLTKDNFEKLNKSIRKRYPKALSGTVNAIWGKTYSFVADTDRSSMLFVNKLMNQSFDKYRRLLEIHFPHVLEKLNQELLKMSEVEKKSAQAKNLNYKMIFQEAEKREYGRLNEQEKKIMFLFKEGNLDEIARLERPITALDLWSIEDVFHHGPAYWARKNQRQSVLEYCYDLMVKKPDIVFRSTPFHWAILCGKSVDEIEHLLPNADIHAAASGRISPLHIAAYEGRLDIIQYLCGKLDAKGLNAGTLNGSTALMIAAKHGYQDIVKYLCQQEKIEINALNKNRETALFLAAKKGHRAVVKYMCEKTNSKINAADIEGKTALMYACENGHFDVVKLLLEQPGIEINAAEEKGATAFMIAAEHGHLDIVKYLYETGKININEKTKKGGTALMSAAGNHHLDVVKYLCAQPGIETTAATEDGNTALKFAVGEYGPNEDSIEVVKYLCAQPQILNEHLSDTKMINLWTIGKITHLVKQWLASNKDTPDHHVLKPLIDSYYGQSHAMWDSGAAHSNEAFLIANMLIEQSNNPATFSTRVEPYLENTTIPDPLKGMIRQVLDNARHSANEEKHEHKI